MTAKQVIQDWAHEMLSAWTDRPPKPEDPVPQRAMHALLGMAGMKEQLHARVQSELDRWWAKPVAERVTALRALAGQLELAATAMEADEETAHE